MNINKIKKAADILYQSRKQKKILSNLPRDCIPVNKNEAYTIQETLAQLYLSDNKDNTIIGKKIGCTNEDAQKQINITEPFYGNIFSTYTSKSHCYLDRNDFFNPFIEPEFSFRMKDEIDLLKAPYTVDEVVELIDFIVPSIEIVDSRFQDWTSIGINSLIADNGANAYWIYGNESENLKKINLYNYSVSLFINDKLIAEGNSSKVLKNPLNSLIWLINTLKFRGKTFPKNIFISTGTCTPAIPVNKNDKIRADFGELGEVILTMI